LLLPTLAAGPGNACEKESRQVPRVRAVAKGIIAADNASDIERVLGYYAPDAVLLPPNEAPVVGREAMRPRYEAMFEGFTPKIEARIDEVCVSGRMAYVRGRNGGRLEGRPGSANRELDDVYLMVLGQGKDGHWSIHRLMWHRASAPAPDRERERLE